MTLHCGYCGHAIEGKEFVLVLCGVAYHLERGLVNGMLIIVEQEQNCLELSNMGERSLVGTFPASCHLLVGAN